MMDRRRHVGYNFFMRALRKWLNRSTGSGPDRLSRPPAGEEDAGFNWVYEPRENVDDTFYSLVEPTPDAHNYIRLNEEETPEPLSAPGALAAADSEGGEQQTKAMASDARATLALTPTRVPQIAYLRHRLDAALERWWINGEVASAGLLRAGLTAVDRGTYLTPDQSALLLRSALQHRRGIVTALSVQEDPDLSALILAEALTSWHHPLTSDLVRAIRDRDPSGAIWFGPLLRELRATSASTDVRTRRLAVEALWQLERPKADVDESLKVNSMPRSMLTILVLVALAAIGSVSWIVFQHATPDDLVQVPAGEHLVLGAEGIPSLVSTDGFEIRRHEVTNLEYRRCVDKGDCSPPQNAAVAGIPNYFADRRFGQYPVVNVTWMQAQQYCEAYEMRLPTKNEWMLAAGAAPATDLPLKYPWGMVGDVQRANLKDTQIGRPTEVGSFSPAGDSPIGAADMAGNIAEWTSSTSEQNLRYAVKGGSFRQGFDSATVFARTFQDGHSAYDWIGFRCVRANERR